MKQKPPLYLIDAYGLIYRSYFAFLSRPLRNLEGKNISALFGFARTLISLLDEGAPAAKEDAKDASETILEKPKFLAAVFDSKAATFRHKMYSEYKATRLKAPEDLHAQVPLIEEFLKALGIPSLVHDGYEADDIIATLAEKCRIENRQCYILSSDKDLLQLVGNGIWELRPSKSNKTEGTLPFELIGSAEVRSEWGVGPEKILDLLSLTGDSSDNIPGVKGIGEKTAIKLMSRYGSLDEIYKNIAGIEGAIGKKLAEGKDSAYFSRSLIKLENQVPLKIKSIDELTVENLNRSTGAKILLREGIRQPARQLDPSQSIENKKQETTQENTQKPQVCQNENTVDTALLGDGIYKVINSIEELEGLLRKARKQKLLALDFETDSLDAWNARPIGLALSIKPKEGFYAPLAAHGEEAFLNPDLVQELLIPIFEDQEMTIAAHNAKYDYKDSRGWGIKRWNCKIWDTMVAAWLLDPERNNYSLDSLSPFYFGKIPIAYKDIVPKGSNFDSVPLDIACSYAAEDADLCLRLKNHLETGMKKSNSLELFLKLEMPLLPILAEMEGAGIKINTETLETYGVELGKELDSIQTKTYKTVGHEFNLSSTQQLQKVLFEERKLKPLKKTKTGFSTDAVALAELAREDEVPALILRHRTLSKLKSTYVDALSTLADKEGRIHTNLIQTGTATGRLSSREPNLQNIPIRDEEGRRIREAFIAKPGWLLVSADYSQIELVVLAHLSEDKNLIEAFKEGKDVHARTASLIFKIDENKVSSEQRRIAKTINFGVMYGMSAFRLANELHISRTDAAAFIEAYFRTYSGIHSFIDSLIKRTEETGFAYTILGRRRFIHNINSSNKTEKAAAERIAVNTPIQGSAADIVKTAMIKLDQALIASEYPVSLLLQVHDELILECKRDAANKVAELVRKEMENAIKLKVPLRVSVETGKSWGDFH